MNIDSREILAPYLTSFKVYRYLFKDYREFEAPKGAEINSIGYILNGEAEFISGDTRFRVKKGDLVFVPKGEVYKSVWRGYPNIEFYSMSFLFQNNFNQSDTAIPTRYILQKIEYDRPEAKELFDCILRDFRKGGQELLMAIGKFYLFYHDICDKIKCVKGGCSGHPVTKAIIYIERNFTGDFSIAYLAKLCNMSESRFYSLFKTITGYTPVGYKNMLRFRAAVEMLSDKSNKIEWISERLNFSSPAYFRRTFKHFARINPSEARRKLETM